VYLLAKGHSVAIKKYVSVVLQLVFFLNIFFASSMHSMRGAKYAKRNCHRKSRGNKSFLRQCKQERKRKKCAAVQRNKNKKRKEKATLSKNIKKLGLPSKGLLPKKLLGVLSLSVCVGGVVADGFNWDFCVKDEHWEECCRWKEDIQEYFCCRWGYDRGLLYCKHFSLEELPLSFYAPKGIEFFDGEVKVLIDKKAILSSYNSSMHDDHGSSSMQDVAGQSFWMVPIVEVSIAFASFVFCIAGLYACCKAKVHENEAKRLRAQWSIARLENRDDTEEVSGGSGSAEVSTSESETDSTEPESGSVSVSDSDASWE